MNSIATKGGNSVKDNVAAACLSFLAGAALMAIKFYAYRITNSSAILSDALESIINVAASAVAFFSIMVAAKPPDESHPYGHGKIEYFSAGFEGALIIVAAIGIFTTGFKHIFDPQPLERLQEGLALLVGASVVNLLLGVLLIRIGKRNQSLALIADGQHILTDVYTTVGVLAGLFLVKYTGWLVLDGAIACVVGINILFTGAMLVRKSFAGLMDSADPELLKEIADLLIACRKDIHIDIHQLRAWRSGNLVHMDFHLILPRDFTLECAHRESKALETIIKEHFGGMASVMIHLDPCLDGECPICSQSPCMLRESRKREEVAWDVSTMTAEPASKGSGAGPGSENEA